MSLYVCLSFMISLKNQILFVVAPHPDDEVIGCGGLIKKVKDEGGKAYVLFLTVGDTRDFSQNGFSTKDERLREIENVAKLLKYDDYKIAFAGNDFHLKLDVIGQKEVMDIIERKSNVSIEKIKPTIVTFPSISSYNQDHKMAADSTHAALRVSSREDKHFVPITLSYEEPADGWSLYNHQQMNFYVSLNKQQIEAKIIAMSLYKSQLRPFPNPRSLETLRFLASFRGSQSSSVFAESFVSYRTAV